MSNTRTDYFECTRHDIASLIPQECRNILEIGAGFGALGSLLSQRADVSIDAVEINPEAAKKLDVIYRHYWIGDVEKLQLEDALDKYDCIIFPDVLEYLVDPWAQLERFCKKLRPGGIIVVSLLNVRNLALLYRLIIKGRWEYEDSGLLDRTHLRFFTRESIGKLIEGSGLNIERWEMNRDNYKGLRKVIATFARFFIAEIDVCQYLVVARKS